MKTKVEKQICTEEFGNSKIQDISHDLCISDPTVYVNDVHISFYFKQNVESIRQ